MHLQKVLNNKSIDCEVVDLSKYDPEQLPSDAPFFSAHLFVISTSTGGMPPDKCDWFFRWIHDAVSDFRIDQTLLKDLNCSIFGLGNSEYGVDYNKVNPMFVHTLINYCMMAWFGDFLLLAAW